MHLYPDVLTQAKDNNTQVEAWLEAHFKQQAVGIPVVVVASSQFTHVCKMVTASVEHTHGKGSVPSDLVEQSKESKESSNTTPASAETAETAVVSHTGGNDVCEGKVVIGGYGFRWLRLGRVGG